MAENKAHGYNIAYKTFGNQWIIEGFSSYQKFM